MGRKPKQKDQVESKITSKQFSEMKGLSNLNAYVLTKKYPKDCFTISKWEEVLKKEELV